MMLFEAFSPLSCSCLLQWQNQQGKVLPHPQGPISAGFLGSLLTASFTPGLQTQLRNMFNPQIWAQGRAKAAWCIASLLCRRQQLPQAVAIPGSPCRPPQYPQAMCPSGTGASPWGANPSAAEPGSRSRVLPAWWCVLSCKLPLFSY